MSRDFPERDWKYLRSIKKEMLDCLCLRINMQAERIINGTEKSDHEKYLDLYRHIQDSDDIVAVCFNDWRRSTITMRIISLLRHDLLKEEHICNLSDESRERVAEWRDLAKWD